MNRPLIFLITLVVVAAAFGVAPKAGKAATTKTFTFAADMYSFTYPSTWSTKQGKKAVTLLPPAANVKKLQQQGVSYTANVQLLNNESNILTAGLRATLKKSWSGFVTAYAKEVTKKNGATQKVSASSRLGWQASIITLQRTVRGTKTTWRITLLSPDKQSVFAVAEKWTKQSSSPFPATIANVVKTLTPFANVQWSFNGQQWRVSGVPPACPNPLLIPSPVDVTLATSMLYPGQYRSGNYKAHGGFRLQGVPSGEVGIWVPQDAFVVDGAHYTENGDPQYMFDLHAPCGIQYRFDHLRTLSPTFATLAAQLPAGGAGDTRTTTFKKPLLVKAGTAIATTVGEPASSNIFFDFGVYDLRQQNTASRNATWTAEHPLSSQSWYAVCWLKLLPAADSAFVLGLPAADGVSGDSSDYCN
ncbi:MAG: hypothetical protein WCV85_03065 [Patescibacteria group bacterium]|jgi:hypothetical protein